MYRALIGRRSDAIFRPAHRCRLRHHRVPSPIPRSSAVSDATEAPRAIFEKCRLDGLAQHVFHGAGGSMFRPVFACEIERLVRPLTKKCEAVSPAEEAGNERRCKFSDPAFPSGRYSAAPLDRQRLCNCFFRNAVQTAQPFADPASLRRDAARPAPPVALDELIHPRLSRIRPNGMRKAAFRAAGSQFSIWLRIASATICSMHAAQHAHFSSNRGKERFLKSCSQPVLHSLLPQTSVQRLAGSTECF